MKQVTRFILVFILLATFAPMAPAKADLGITPVRIVFEGRGRSATVQLVNLTDHTNTYRMGWLTMKARPEGGYEVAQAADQNDPYSVAKMIVFTPRQVTIEPHGQQTIRLSLRRPADLPFGEYRAHMSLVRMARDVQPLRVDPEQKDISLALDVNVGFSIPVIVRSGEDKDLKISLSSPRLKMTEGKKPVPKLNIDINRDAGTFSSYGFLDVYWQPPQGKEEKIGRLDNVALYPEIKQRHMEVPLDKVPTGGNLRVVYRGKYESEGTTWAEKSFPIGK